MLKVYLGIGLLTCTFQATSQSISRQSIGTMGTSMHSEELSVQQSVGQPYQTHSYYSNEIQSRPGFIQPTQFIIDQVNSTFTVEILAFPNPTTASVSFNASSELENINVQVVDQTGKLIFTEEVKNLRGYMLNCVDWNSGYYFVRMVDGSKNVYQAKIIKN